MKMELAEAEGQKGELDQKKDHEKNVEVWVDKIYEVH